MSRALPISRSPPGLTPGAVYALLPTRRLSPLDFLRADAGEPSTTDNESGDGANGARERAQATFKAEPVS
jgi:hypothetical protein